MIDISWTLFDEELFGFKNDDAALSLFHLGLPFA
jgi:hypothetical protein